MNGASGQYAVTQVETISTNIEHSFTKASVFLSVEIQHGIVALSGYKTSIDDGVRPAMEALEEFLEMLHPLAKQGEKKVEVTLNSVPLFAKTLVEFEPYKHLFGEEKAEQHGGLIGEIVKFLKADPKDAAASITGFLKEKIDKIGADTHPNTPHAVSAVPLPPHTHLWTHHSSRRCDAAQEAL